MTRDRRTDLRLILAVQTLRAFGYGFASIALGSSLAAGGLTDVEVGVVLTAMLAGMALASVLVALRGDEVGRRRAYVGSLVVMAVVGVVFATTDLVPLLVVAALTGVISTDPNESGPITSLEQSMLSHAPAELRTRVFGRYNAVAYLAGAVGSLAAGGPAALRGAFPALPSTQRWLFVLTGVGLASALLAARLSDSVEVGGTGGRSRGRPLERSRGTLVRLVALFGLDAFAGGFVVQTFMVFWFGRRFGASPELMGLVFFAAGVLQAGSSIVAGRLGSAIGLLNTMVFTHLPSNVLLLLVPVMPSLPWAIAVLLARFALSQMDVPTRQAYVATLVPPEERTAAAAFTNTARYVARPLGPVGAGALMSSVAVGAPFVVAGGLKIVYDLLLFRTFRHVALPEEPATPPRPAR